MSVELDEFIEYFNKKHEEQFDIIRCEISHEEIQNLSQYKDIDEALDYLINIHHLEIDKTKFHSVEIITEVFQEGKENKKLIKPQLIIRLTKYLKN
jgi:hypothetical protein